MNVLVKDNKVNYTSLATASDGQQFFNKIFTKYRIYTKTQYLSTGQSTSELWLQQYTGLYTKIILTRFHGTITRNDITDGTTFYYFVDDGPAMDNVSFIPCNTEDCVTHVDEWYFRTNISNSGFWNVYINVFPCNNNYKTISITFTVNLQVDCYCM